METTKWLVPKTLGYQNGCFLAVDVNKKLIKKFLVNDFEHMGEVDIDLQTSAIRLKNAVKWLKLTN